MFQVVQLTDSLARNVRAILIGMTPAQAQNRAAAWAKETGKAAYLLKYDPERPGFFDRTLATALPSGEIINQ